MTQRDKEQERIISVGNLCLSYGSVIYDLESSNAIRLSRAKQRVIEVLHARKQEWEERHRQMQEQFRAISRNEEQDEPHPYMDTLMEKHMKGRQ